MRCRLALVSVLIGAGAARAEAQPPPDFSRLEIKVGDILYVTDPDGVEVSGPLAALVSTVGNFGWGLFAQSDAAANLVRRS